MMQTCQDGHGGKVEVIADGAGRSTIQPVRPHTLDADASTGGFCISGLRRG